MFDTSTCSQREMQTQLSSLSHEELLYAKPEERKSTKKRSTLPPLRGGKLQAHLYGQLEERGASNIIICATPPTILTPSDHLYAQLEEREVSDPHVEQITATLEDAQSQDVPLHPA